MAKSFDDILNNLPAQDKETLNQAKGLVSNAEQTKSTEIKQHSTPNDTALDAHRTKAPTAEQGKSATMSEVNNKPITQEKPPPTPEPDKDR